MRGVVFCFFLCFPSTLLSQTLLVEDFVYPAGESLTSHGWTAYGAAGINPVLVHSPGLEYPGHPGSGVGNAARLSGTDEDVRRSFAAQSDKTVYVSFLVEVRNATTGTADKHFLHLNTSPQIGRVYARRTSGSIAFGLEHGAEGPVFTDAVYAMNAVYLLVLRYDHVSGAANDAARLYVFENGVPAVEPAVPTLGPTRTTGSEPSSLSGVSLRQADSPDNDFIIDGIRVGTSWSEAGLPVELSSFGARAEKGFVELGWRTESETENYGWEVERRTFSGFKFQVSGSETWNRIGFVQGAGTSSSPKEYVFVDGPVQPGRYAYRLKQIDLDGTTTWSREVIAMVETDDSAAVVGCYPNPFNGTANFIVRVSEEGRVQLTVHDVLGRKVITLLDERKVPGIYRVSWPAVGAPSGVYYYTGEVGGKRTAGKLVFVK
ncbi:MAG: T9SS type A sorting domain-containing protein [Ignavibacterium sp.]